MSSIDIIGGAIAGPAAGYALARAGHNVTVHEQLMPEDLVSQQILGVDPHVWDIMRAAGLDPERYSIPNMYHIFGTKHSSRSPYHYVPWLGFHDMLVSAGTAAGVRYIYGSHVRPSDLSADYVIDATGIAGAARDRLPFTYSGRVIYRGRSPMPVHGEFTVFQDSVTAFAGGDDKNGQCNWQLYATRPQPAQMRTMPATMPPEADLLPFKLRSIVQSTPDVLVTPLSFWSERPHMRGMTGGMRNERMLMIGDVLGAIAPATTAGASLATLEGLETPVLLAGGPAAAKAEHDCLVRRQYVLTLGATLARPEIGGNHEDPHFVMHEQMIYGGL
jgi:2-polyprenyl-6-methoxyphenol hydroxylase-like FAD-dependent oxidoreductase